MRCRVLVAGLLFIAGWLSLGISASRAGDLFWEVENPYRFFKRASSFEAQEKAFDAVRGAAGDPLPTDILWRLERRLNDPDCKDRSSPAQVPADSRRPLRAEPARLGCADARFDLLRS